MSNLQVSQAEDSDTQIGDGMSAQKPQGEWSEANLCQAAQVGKALPDNLTIPDRSETRSLWPATFAE
jgi:hypothetical protein